MNKGIVKEGILGVLQLRWQGFFKDYRLHSLPDNINSADDAGVQPAGK
jgi:hypothetical protein